MPHALCSVNLLCSFYLLPFNVQRFLSSFQFLELKVEIVCQVQHPCLSTRCPFLPYHNFLSFINQSPNLLLTSSHKSQSTKFVSRPDTLITDNTFQIQKKEKGQQTVCSVRVINLCLDRLATSLQSLSFTVSVENICC